MKTTYRFIRHAHAHRKHDRPDSGRVLDALGYDQTSALHKMLRDEGPVITACFHSEATRAAMTAVYDLKGLVEVITASPLLYNCPTGSVERTVLEWAAGQYGTHTRMYRANPIVALALENYVDSAVEMMQNEMNKAAAEAEGCEKIELAFVGHAVWIQAYCLRLLTARQPVLLPDGRSVELEDLALGECDQLIVSFDGEGGEELAYIPLVETENIRRRKAELAAESREPAAAATD